MNEDQEDRAPQPLHSLRTTAYIHKVVLTPEKLRNFRSFEIHSGVFPEFQIIPEFENFVSQTGFERCFSPYSTKYEHVHTMLDKDRLIQQINHD